MLFEIKHRDKDESSTTVSQKGFMDGNLFYNILEIVVLSSCLSLSV